MSDSALIALIGDYVRHHRLEQNKTQSQLAHEAGIDRSTLAEFEKGRRSNLLTLVQLLRALGLLDVLKAFQVIRQISPLKLAELQQAQRKRASRKRARKTDW